MRTRKKRDTRPTWPKTRVKRHLLASLLALGLYSVPVVPIAAANGPIVAQEAQDAQEAQATDQQNVAASQQPRVLKLTPAGEPTPALRYRFWPSRLEMQPGNAFVRFQRAILLMKSAEENAKTASSPSNLETWLDTPIENLPTDSVREFLSAYQAALDEALEARLLRDSEYELGAENIRGTRALNLSLPEIQEMRSLAKLLQLQVRLQVAEGKIDEAIETLQSGFRLGEATGQAADFLITRLIGLSITSSMLKEVETCIQHQDCPNLYWALATLPPTSYEVEEAVAFESEILIRYFPELNDLPEENLPAEFWRKKLTKAIINLISIEENDFTEQFEEEQEKKVALRLGMTILALTESSRSQLIDAGISEDRVSSMSPEEMVVRATAASLQQAQDDVSKWTLIPQETRSYYLWYAEHSLADRSKHNLGYSIAKAFLPAIAPSLEVGERVKRKIWQLTTIESIRNHVFMTKQLPEQINLWNSENPLQLLPAWTDTIKSNQFSYQKIGNSSAQLTWEDLNNWYETTSIVLEF